MAVIHSAPRYASNGGMLDNLSAAIGSNLISAHEEHGELIFTV